MDILEIILLVITVGIGYVLYATLGKRTGHHPSEPMTLKPAWRQKPGDTSASQTSLVMPEETPFITALKQLKLLDPRFDPLLFSHTARNNFESIVQGFVKGDVKILQQYLSPALYTIYAKAIEERNQAQQQVEMAFFRLVRADIQEIHLKGTLASIKVKFTSEQSQVLKDAQGKILEGNPNMLDDIHEIWIFEKNMKTSGGHWLLTETYAA